MEGKSLSLENDLRKAERDGISISKERLIRLIRDAKQQQFIVVQNRDTVFAIVPVTTKH
jgi:hypothetical protein